MNNQETIKYLRAEAKKLGLTFKVDQSLTINDKPAYMFVCRKSGRVVLSNCTLTSALNNMCSGYVTGLTND